MDDEDDYTDEAAERDDDPGDVPIQAEAANDDSMGTAGGDAE
jgi:hypothetical protein